MSGLRLPRIYAILDADAVRSCGADLLEVAAELRRAGVRLLQYRDKSATMETVLANARALRGIFPADESMLLLNDWAELVAEAGCDGVHLGQGDLAPARARALLGQGRLIGLSTHTKEEARAAEAMAEVDYVAIGPVFGTVNKQTPEPVVGLAGVRAARAVVRKPLVAIGGIDETAAGPVLGAGADAIAMIGAMARGAADGAEALRTRFGAWL